MATLEKPAIYPQIQIILLTSLPILQVTRPDAFTAFCDHSGLSDKEATKIFTNGYAPIIKIKGTPNRGYGWTPEPPTDEVWLHRPFIEQVESLMSGRSEITSGPYNYYADQSFTKRVLLPRLRLLVEVTVLHELVHFARQLVNGYNPDRPAEERVARMFEKKAFGQVHTVTSLGLAGLIDEPH
jgi:hypothetical protein